MSFEEQFPSLKGKVAEYGPGDDGTPEIYDCLLDIHDEEAQFSYGDSVITTYVVEKYCLDKKRVKDAILKLTKYGLDNDNGCGDPECCGGRDYYISDDADNPEYILAKQLLEELGL